MRNHHNTYRNNQSRPVFLHRSEINRQTPTSVKDHASNTAPKFPTIQRSRSPKPPKPSPAETEYLRRILADVSFPSNSPFALLRPPLLHDPTSGAPGEKEKVGGPAWLGLGARTFSGIEECLRMFTAVEVLDGENMVGCRRCWKIQNGVFQSKKDDSDEEEGKKGVKVLCPFLERRVNPTQKHGTTFTGSSAHFEHHPESYISQQSNSSPGFPIYSYSIVLPQRESHSISSLPTSLSDANLNLLKDKNASADGSVSHYRCLSSPNEANIQRSRINDVAGHKQGPGGLPIPIISTTAPMDASSTSSSMPSDSGSESNYSSASEGKSLLFQDRWKN
jgi:hypothetical protein